MTAHAPLFDWLAAIGPPTEPVVASTVQDWLALAAGRPEWMLWGKARPKGVCPAHTLLGHMLDVAAVAARLITEAVPPALRDRLLAIADDPQEALKALLFIVALHDLGKATPAFVAKAAWADDHYPGLGLPLNPPSHARHHGEIGLYYLEQVLLDLGAGEAALPLGRAVTAHHGQFPSNADIEDEPGPAEAGMGRWPTAREGVVQVLAELFEVTDLSALHTPDHAWVVLFAGLTAVADWIGSMDDIFIYEAPPPSAAEYWARAWSRAAKALERVGMRPPTIGPGATFKVLFPAYEPWPLHRQAEAVAAELAGPALIVVEAPMGEGKTEASFLLAEAAARQGQAGLYIGLPTQATANQMFRRVTSYLCRTRPDQPTTLMLAHGEATLVEAFRQLVAHEVYDKQGHGRVRAEGWFLSKKRSLLADFAVGTLDQALLAVMRVPHAFVRLYGLAGKTVVLDEIHAYDTYTGKLLESLVEWLAAAGSTVVLLSATLPNARRLELIHAWQRGRRLPILVPDAAQYPRVSVVTDTATRAGHFEPRGRPLQITLEQVPDEVDQLAARAMAAAAQGACVGWICNTVQRAQAVYQRIRAFGQTLLLHAALLPDDRGHREQTLETWLGPGTQRLAKPELGETLGPPAEGRTRPLGCIVVGTQVLEQSLDVDFDLMLTDLAPVDLVLQRTGRLFRHDRGDRALGFHPHLILIRPEGDISSVRWKDVAIVYPELLVKRTLEVLEKVTVLSLPDDIDPLVQCVYRDALVPPTDQLYTAANLYLGEQMVKDFQAQQKLMPSPTDPDDPFADLQVHLSDDDDPLTHARLRAQTRLGPPSLELVCLEGRGGQVFVGDGDPRPLDLTREPDRALVARLVRRSIGTTRHHLVHHLAAQPAPEGWQGSALLRHRRPVVFIDGRAHINGIDLTLDPELGLCLAQGGTP
jgi:CRISPR-associated endonuclease/helicase Cas3